eukprot:7406393-Alexandrium_andersonii.AAC.1
MSDMVAADIHGFLGLAGRALARRAIAPLQASSMRAFPWSRSWVSSSPDTRWETTVSTYSCFCCWVAEASQGRLGGPAPL